MDLVREFRKKNQIFLFHGHMTNQIKVCHKRPRGPNWNKMVFFHHTPLNKEGWENVGDVVGFTIRKIALIRLKLPPPTLILVNHVPIIICMGMMQIIVLLYIQN